MNELWLPIVEFEEYYEVSNLGRVRSLFRTVTHPHSGKKTIPARELGQSINRGGYVQVVLSKDGKSKPYRVHRLVLSAFVEPAPDKDANHKDGDRTNNTLDNLEWVTRSENHKHAYRELGRTPPAKGKFGAAHHNALAVIGLNERTGDIVKFASLMDAHRAGFQSSQISMCLRGKRATHKGFKWEKLQ